MEKISKKKAVFRVEFKVYAISPEQYLVICDDIISHLYSIQDIISTYEPGVRHGITGIAQLLTARRIAK